MGVEEGVRTFSAKPDSAKWGNVSYRTVSANPNPNRCSDTKTNPNSTPNPKPNLSKPYLSN